MDHTHSINHDHPEVTSGSGSAHSHTIDHDHPNALTSWVNDHTHGPGSLTGYYKGRGSDDSGSGASGLVEYTYSAYNTTSNDSSVVINAGATAWAGGHYHDLDIPNFSASSSSEGSHTHTVDLPSYSGTSGASSAANTGSSGNGWAHNNLQPYIVLTYIIKAA